MCHLAIPDFSGIGSGESTLRWVFRSLHALSDDLLHGLFGWPETNRMIGKETAWTIIKGNDGMVCELSCNWILTSCSDWLLIHFFWHRQFVCSSEVSPWRASQMKPFRKVLCQCDGLEPHWSSLQACCCSIPGQGQRDNILIYTNNIQCILWGWFQLVSTCFNHLQSWDRDPNFPRDLFLMIPRISQYISIE